MSDSDDEVLAVRARRTAVIALDSSDESSLPSWMAEHKSPAGEGLPTSSDSSDVEQAASPLQPAAGAEAASQPERLLQQGAAPPAAAAGTAAAGSRQQQQQRPGQASTPQGAAGRGRAAAAAERAGDAPGEAPASQAALQPATAPKKAAGGALHGPTAAMPLMLPDKLPHGKLLVELESVEGGATDLAGDAGAVGRVLVSGPPGDQQLEIDLKGILYSATIVPCPGTIAVVNVGQSEAKVEALFTEFLQLREDTRFSCQDTGGLDTYLAEDQEENYMLAGDANEGEEGAKKGRKKAGETKAAGAGKGRGRPKGAAGAKGGAAKGAGRGLKKTAGGGVKKARGGGAAKPAKPKPKAKASKPLGGAGKKGGGKGK